MNRIALSILTFCCVYVLAACNQRSGPSRILVFTKTAGFHHESIPAGIEAIRKLGQENQFTVDTTTDAALFNEDSLRLYNAVVFLQTTGDVLNNFQEADFERYIQAGGGYVGVHAATDTEYDWGWYGRLVGGYFASHPAQQEAELQVIDSTHISTSHLPRTWKRKDEWYNFKKLNPGVKLLMKLNEKSYTGGTNGDNHPVAWYHEYDGGRAWYTALGHTNESFSDPLYLNHLLGGIRYAIGDRKELDYKKAHTLRVPENDRFKKTQLVLGELFEPTEMTILPNFDVLIAQRRGELMLYKSATKKTSQVGSLNVYWKTDAPGVNSEEGLLGLQADPDFGKNNFIYLFYSPVSAPVDRLSRFVFKDDSLHLASEKVILDVPVQRDICCHTGGSIAFGKDRTLFVSTGDNSTPFNEPEGKYNLYGYSPLDDRPGLQQYDARRGAGNSNDLRGKILRIRINEDGTYSIPDGNLFAKNESKAKPEIYVMGNRNPYRISVDKKNDFLYWGEVGPDSNIDSLGIRGPMGYDEVNQARTAGNFGWPYFVGNNYPYVSYDYTTGKSGKPFDAKQPVNESRNNTGLQQLPPAQPAFIWYPYGPSSDFPQVGTGGRTAMAGPVFYTDLYSTKERLAEYYDKKLFVYEWIRGWIMAVTMKENGDFDKMEPFVPHLKFNAPVDMEMGPDGRIYVLEYGSGWFSKNADAGLARIDYNAGNREPAISDVSVTPATGNLPLTIKATVTVKDPEKDALTYRWHINNVVKETKTPELEYTINDIGSFKVYAEVVDAGGAAASSTPIEVYAGNAAPEVDIQVKGNRSFYFPGRPVQYEVKVTDPGNAAVVDPADLFVSASFLESADRAQLGHQILSEPLQGKNLISSSDCMACHKVNEKSVGPAFTAVADRYAKDKTAPAYLAEKIMKGGSGVWGEVAMAAHPDMKEQDAKMIVQYILSLGKDAKKNTLPPTGSVPVPAGTNPQQTLVLSASYTDKGNQKIRPLTGNGSVQLLNSRMRPNQFSTMKGFSKGSEEGRNWLQLDDQTGWFAVDSVDLTNIRALQVQWQQGSGKLTTVELRLDAPDGRVIAATKAGGSDVSVIPVTPVNDGRLHTLYIVVQRTTAETGKTPSLTSIEYLPAL
ncbi:ThuA domain-containing protein [Flavihumibacter solisilvae]|uniref:Crp/Fnr family transcriptional regulator n=1 Tax=Flavihumibacter solisilvae TaxID=1349421 RepID=A0A0C1IPV3_9BACT|nr:ThuA domain-containing protein [Flavihumibacter solisilvae]KIC96270.1 Crp/Fnr family transcriptional regulator [Flavihumibacter solisilvae]